MIYKVDRNPQLDTCDWSMYLNILKYLCCKTEHKIQHEFLPKTKDFMCFKCLWSKNFELQKCGHTEKSNYELNLSIILMFLTIYGVGKSQCDDSND